MGVVDNELNWRRVFSDTPVDVSGWSIADRMKIPDFCFGNRQVASCYIDNDVAATDKFQISGLALPDPVVIWNMQFTSMPTPGAVGWLRVGLRATIPTTDAEMDTAIEILPDYGAGRVGPNYLILYSGLFMSWPLVLRKGMVSGGNYLVIQLHCDAPIMNVFITMTFSALPVSVPTFLNPKIP